jgi:hypothetical protein
VSKLLLETEFFYAQCFGRILFTAFEQPALIIEFFISRSTFSRCRHHLVIT